MKLETIRFIYIYTFLMKTNSVTKSLCNPPPPLLKGVFGTDNRKTVDNRNTSGDHSVLPQDDSRKPAAHVRYLSQLTEISFGWVPLNQPTLVKSALTPFRVKRMMDCLLCSHILFVLKLSFQSPSQYSAANVVLYIVLVPMSQVKLEDKRHGIVIGCARIT